MSELALRNFDFCINHNQYFWYDEDELVAMVEVKKENGCKWICGLFVSPTYRMRGIGKSILTFVKLLGAEKLAVSKKNHNAILLYKKSGFVAFDEDNDFLYMIWRDDNE